MIRVIKYCQKLSYFKEKNKIMRATRINVGPFHRIRDNFERDHFMGKSALHSSWTTKHGRDLLNKSKKDTTD